MARRIKGVLMSDAAAKNVRTIKGFDPSADVEGMLAGTWTKESLLEDCLTWNKECTEEGWRDYVDAVVSTVEGMRKANVRA